MTTITTEIQTFRAAIDAMVGAGTAASVEAEAVKKNGGAALDGRQKHQVFLSALDKFSKAEAPAASAEADGVDHDALQKMVNYIIAASAMDLPELQSSLGISGGGFLSKLFGGHKAAAPAPAPAPASAPAKVSLQRPAWSIRHAQQRKEMEAVRAKAKSAPAPAKAEADTEAPAAPAPAATTPAIVPPAASTPATAPAPVQATAPQTPRATVKAYSAAVSTNPNATRTKAGHPLVKAGGLLVIPDLPASTEGITELLVEASVARDLKRIQELDAWRKAISYIEICARNGAAINQPAAIANVRAGLVESFDRVIDSCCAGIVEQVAAATKASEAAKNIPKPNNAAILAVSPKLSTQGQIDLLCSRIETATPSDKQRLAMRINELRADLSSPEKIAAGETVASLRAKVNAATDDTERGRLIRALNFAQDRESREQLSK